MDTIIASVTYKIELLINAFRTGNFDTVINEIKAHVITNKNTYIVLTFLVVLYTLYEQDYNTYALKLPYRIRHLTQLGGETKEPIINPEPNAEGNSPTPKKSDGAISNDSAKGKKTASNNNSSSNTASSSGKASQLAQGASGLCDGDGTIAKMCRGGKDGVTNYFKFFGYLILAGLAVVSPFVIYIVLVYMMLKIMFTGLKNI